MDESRTGNAVKTLKSVIKSVVGVESTDVPSSRNQGVRTLCDDVGLLQVVCQSGRISGAWFVASIVPDGG